jgi:aldose sugar dehydrogenase
VVRLTQEGGVPTDNPFVGNPAYAPEIYSYGHRNIQGIVRHPVTGEIWATEHGPRGGDELNRIVAGANYGWPLATHGIDYNRARVTPYRQLPGMRAPLLDWTPAIAPAGMTLYRGELFPHWQGDLFVSALVAKEIRRVRLKGDEVVEEQRLFGELEERMRDVRTGPDGVERRYASLDELPPEMRRLFDKFSGA